MTVPPQIVHFSSTSSVLQAVIFKVPFDRQFYNVIQCTASSCYTRSFLLKNIGDKNSGAGKNTSFVLSRFQLAHQRIIELPGPGSDIVK